MEIAVALIENNVNRVIAQNLFYKANSANFVFISVSIVEY